MGPGRGPNVLRALLTTPLTITPVDDGSGIQGHGALDRVLTGESPGRPGRRVTKTITTALVPPGDSEDLYTVAFSGVSRAA
jgi:hypothetical protein